MADKKKKIISVVGARPNFMKVAPLARALAAEAGIRHLIVHTGQHYDDAMSKIFFTELAIPRPDINLGVGSGKQGEQTGKIMIEFERVCEKEKPDLVLVYGDVNSTAAAALVAAKMRIPLGHVEAGLRSFDRDMPEEINRVLADALADHLFTHSKGAGRNLIREGIAKKKIHFVGNIMADTLLFNRKKAEKSEVLKTLALQKGGYAVLTLHRPGNVDDRDKLGAVLAALGQISVRFPVVFPVHPRTANLLKKFGIRLPAGLKLLPPLGYLDFLNLMMNCRFMLTDSGGIQEETTMLGIPCLTLRDSTERPVTVTEGTNTLVGSSRAKLVSEAGRILKGRGKGGRRPERWDGQTAARIVRILMGEL